MRITITHNGQILKSINADQWGEHPLTDAIIEWEIYRALRQAKAGELTPFRRRIWLKEMLGGEGVAKKIGRLDVNGSKVRVRKKRRGLTIAETLVECEA